MMARCTLTITIVLLFVFLRTNVGASQDNPTDKRVDASIQKALKWLSSQQRSSGAWIANGTGRHGESTAGTSLAIMAFLAAGHVPGEGPYGSQIDRGIRYVLKHQKPDGLLSRKGGHDAMYSHGIATLMLGEVYGMVDKELRRPVKRATEKAVLLILKSQNVRKSREHAGGWRYSSSSTDSDLSVTGWQLLALRAAKNIGCDVPADAIDYAVEYVKKCRPRNGRGFSYQVYHGPTPTRTGTGILCLEVCGKHKARETMIAADYLMQHRLDERQSWYYYGVYYCTVGMFKVGGKHWEFMKSEVVGQLLRLQRNDGRWESRNNERSAGTVYCTSMAVLALAVEYQFLPIYQR